MTYRAEDVSIDLPNPHCLAGNILALSMFPKAEKMLTSVFDVIYEGMLPIQSARVGELLSLILEDSMLSPATESASDSTSL